MNKGRRLAAQLRMRPAVQPRRDGERPAACGIDHRFSSLDIEKFPKRLFW